MNLKAIEAVVQSQFVWAILCIVVAIVLYQASIRYISDLKVESNSREFRLVELYEKQRSESVGREERLMTHLERTTDTLDTINDRLEDLDREIGAVNSRFDAMYPRKYNPERG
jgi:predicted Holliday junction resolvase-like endonuclease